MSADETVTHWIDALKAGDEEAARLLWHRYFQQIVELARDKLRTASRRVADEEDVALSVFRRLCDGARRGKFAQMTDRDDLWRLLTTITARRAIDQIRRQSPRKRGHGRVRGDSAFYTGRDEGQGGIDALAGNEPTPEFLHQLAEEHDRLLSTLNDETLRQVANWRLDGYSNDEIAHKLGLTTRSIERKLHRIREIWRDEIEPHAV
jgi:RNA polymerase sigma factor (sigma-70 family)